MIRRKPWEKLSVLRVVWIGMPSKMGQFDVRGWIREAHKAPAVPVTLVYGENDRRSSRLFQKLTKDGAIQETFTPKTSLTGEQLLDPEGDAVESIQSYLVKTLNGIRPQPWARRQIDKLWSFWEVPSANKGQPELLLAKKPGDTLLTFVPLDRLDVRVPGMQVQQPHVPFGPGMPGR